MLLRIIQYVATQNRVVLPDEVPCRSGAVPASASCLPGLLWPLASADLALVPERALFES